MDKQGREKRLHPILIVAIFVVVALEIHPFQDGNGRLSRILTTLPFLRAGYAYVPCSSLESIIEQSKESYYISLRRTQETIRSAEPDRNPWIEFFLRALHRQKSRLEKKMVRERIILADMPGLSVRLLELRASADRSSSRRLPGSPMQAVTPSRIISRHSWIKGTSSCTVPAAALGAVFPDNSDARPISACAIVLEEIRTRDTRMETCIISVA
jgi:hypothetical protein